MMKEFVNKLSYEELEKLELLIAETKRKRDLDFVEELMNNVVNALEKAKAELSKRFGDEQYIILELNGYTHYFDESFGIEVRLENKDDECDSETLYYESFYGGRTMLVAILGSLAIICGTVGALGLCEKWLEHMGIFPEDYEDF